MRWDNLRLVDREAPGDGGMPLPLFEQGAVVRTFDTPEFRGVTFYEVRAKSIINRVPDASHMPFRWTINPYRGCTHSCFYCAAGDTPVLMADGRTRPLADIAIGDRVYGTERIGAYRRYVTTEVLDHWSTVKPAYRVILEDGTELVASGDHRFLTDRGWKHVTGAEHGRDRRPFLTVNNKLMGTGRFASLPAIDRDYERGYLTGMIRGDGSLGSYSYVNAAGRYGIVHRFRLALVDLEAVRRSQAFLENFGVGTDEFLYQAAAVGRRQMMAIRTQSRGRVLAIEEAIRWPTAPGDAWSKGFLAGIFDAEGSYSGGILRMSNTDRAIVHHLTTALRRLGFAFTLERPARHDRMTVVRVRGGIREHLRFFQTVDPAITRKRTIEGQAIKNNAPLRVVSVEPLGLDMPLYDIATGTGDFIANGVVSHNCFARNTHTYLDLDYGEDFNSQVVVKVNAAELLRKELSARKWSGEHIAMGTNVDPYQRAEGRYRLMPPILEALRDFANPFSILTKGSLILRDLALLEQCAAVTDVGANVSVGFVDRDLWRSLEPGTPSPQKRLEVCRALNDVGVGCGVLMAPIIPFLSDSPAQLADTVAAIAESGANHVTPIVLHLRTGAREWFMAWLAEHHSDLVERYERLYGRGAYAPKAYQDEITGRVHELARKLRIGRARPGEARRVRPAPAVDARPEQLSLM
jgi:DNA repair photolyase